MSHTYQIAPLLAAAISRLKQTFTAKLHVWDVKRYEAQAHPIEAVNLFRALDRPDMLVTALYACCQLPARAVVQGTERADGVVECLAPADLEVCWELRKTLTARDAAILRAGGYELGPVLPVDQFLYSAHVELVATFRRPATAVARKRRPLLG